MEHTHPDAPALEVLSSLFNGFGGSLFEEIRSRQVGLALSVPICLASPRGPHFSLLPGCAPGPAQPGRRPGVLSSLSDDACTWPRQLQPPAVTSVGNRSTQGCLEVLALKQVGRDGPDLHVRAPKDSLAPWRALHLAMVPQLQQTGVPEPACPTVSMSCCSGAGVLHRGRLRDLPGGPPRTLCGGGKHGLAHPAAGAAHPQPAGTKYNSQYKRPCAQGGGLRTAPMHVRCPSMAAARVQAAGVPGSVGAAISDPRWAGFLGFAPGPHRGGEWWCYSLR